MSEHDVLAVIEAAMRDDTLGLKVLLVGIALCVMHIIALFRHFRAHKPGGK